MMKNAKTYLTRIQAAATERELTGIEIAFKQDMSINCDDLGRLCRAAEDKRHTLRNNAETLRIKDILFQRTKAEMDAYHDMSRKPESWTAEDIAHQRIRFCSIWRSSRKRSWSMNTRLGRKPTPTHNSTKRYTPRKGAVPRI